MKKIKLLGRYYPFQKIWCIMKISSFLLFFSMLYVSAEVYSQRTSLTLDMQQAGLREVIKQIESQSEFLFLYNTHDIDDNIKVDIRIKNQKIDQILDYLLKETNISYLIRDRHILLIPNKETEEDLTGVLESHVILQQGIRVTGTVTDEVGEPLPGVNVIIRGTTTGTVTDSEGMFSITVPDKETVLSFSFVSYNTREIVVGDRRNLEVAMQETIQAIEEVVIVGYGVQKKATVTGAVTSVAQEDLLKSPVGNVTGALVGRVTGIQTVQRGGQPGNDGTSIRIRGSGTLTEAGSNPLILVDGIERSFDQLDPDEIESISILKDAATTAVYGIRGANGVILVTTKRGKEGPAKVTYSGNIAFQRPTRLPSPLNSYDYARLYNEARRNDEPNVSGLYTDDDLQKFKDGSDPVLHPNTNWLKSGMDDIALQQRHNVNVSGGTSFARYYVTLGYFSQDGIQKEFNERYNYSNKDDYKRFNFRSNVDLDITRTTRLSLTLGGKTGYKTRVPNSNYFQTAVNSAPLYSPGMVNDRLITAEGGHARNPIGDLTRGLSKYTEDHIDINLEGVQKLDFLLKGLAVRVKGAYDNNYEQQIQRTKSEPMYWASAKEIDGVRTIVYRQEGEVTELGIASESFSKRDERIYLEAALTYQQAFGKHEVSGLALATQNKRWFNGGDFPSVPTGYIEFVGRATYNYAYKYFAEVNMGYNGSENFPKGARFGFFPAFSAGWVISRERFFENLISPGVVSYIKLRASYGQVGNDKLYIGNVSQRFLYFPSEYEDGTTVNFGSAQKPTGYKGYKEGKLGNPGVVWEKAVKTNFGIETKFLKDKLFINADYFFDTRDNILTQMNTIPGHTAINSGVYNIGSTENKGCEIEAGWNHTVRKFNYWVKGNYSFARNKIIEMDEAKNLENPHLWKTGRRVGEVFGYVFEGFFNSEEEIQQWPSQFGFQLKPGDVKYADVNGDGVVDTYDQVPIRHPNFPEISYGFSGGFSFKGFDFSILFQGASNVSMTLGTSFMKPFAEYGAAFEHILDRWHEGNPQGAKYPVLTANYSSDNNYYKSDLWCKDASYLRLKNLEVGYNFRKIPILGISSLRISFSAQNLYTWDNLKIVDPEAEASDQFKYPQLAIYNIGLNVKF